MKAVLALLCVLVVSAQAQTMQDKAESSAWIDTAQTIVGVGSGIVAEANPLGLAALVLKIPALEHCKAQPQYEQPACFASLSVVWSGAVANNWCVLGAIVLSAGALAPLCPLAGIAYGVSEWTRAQPELEFWAICGQWQKEYDAVHPHGPPFTCRFAPLS